MVLSNRADPYYAHRILALALFLGLIIHGGLLPFTITQTYDAHIHMFFGDHYHRSWFDPWEPRWYTGFTVTAYPPGSHQLIGLLLYLIPHHAAFIIVQVLAVLILVLGVYRFSRLWVSDIAAAFASLLCVGSTAIAETVHIFGQLPTTLSLGIFLSATPHIYAWIKEGRRGEIPLALALTAGATAAHHVTPIFATLFFVVPLGLHAWSATLPKNFSVLNPSGWPPISVIRAAPLRGLILGLMMIAIIILVVFPYWHWSVTDPITQVTIPHGSRQNFLEHPNYGLMFFIIPWGLLLAIIPYIAWCALRSALWPLAISVLLCLLLGTGGTTPLPKLLLGPAYEILTLDRFTFWATIMTLPFAGACLVSLFFGKARTVLVAALGKTTANACATVLVISYALTGIMVAALPLIKPTQPAALDPDPIVQFMAKDDHNRWRYLTLGFGDQFAYHSALIDGLSVDGNYHSARRLPHLTAYSVERLENSKYLGLPGLDSLTQVVTNAEAYHLKYIFSNDAFYDPLLYFGGWTRLLRLSNGVVVWEKPGVTPLSYPLPRQTFVPYKRVMWGTIPPLSLLLSFVLLVRQTSKLKRPRETSKQPHLVSQIAPSPKLVTTIRYASLALLLSGPLIALGVTVMPAQNNTAENTLRLYYTDLDRRNFKAAFETLNPATRPAYQTYLKILRDRGGLIWSYAKLLDIETKTQSRSATKAQVEVVRTYLTALGTHKMTSTENLSKTANGWRLKDPVSPKTLTNALMTRDTKPVLQDLSVTRTAARGTSALSFDSPVITASRPVLINLGEHMRVVGAVTNTSSYSACLDVVATGQFKNGQVATQHMGTLGSHRLAPGETRHYSIEFEGRLTQASSADSRLQSAQHRLPRFAANPERVSIQVSTFSCQINAVSGIVLNDFQMIDQRALQVTLTNHGTKVAGIVKLSLIYSDQDGRAVLIKPHYLETNLIPGEIKTQTIPLHIEAPFRIVRSLHAPKVNGQRKDHTQNLAATRIPFKQGPAITSVSIELEAMPFSPPL